MWKRILYGFVFDNIFIAFCAVSLLKVSQVILHLSCVLTATDVFVFSSTLLVYNLHKSLSLLRKQSFTEVLLLVFSSLLSLEVRILICTGFAGIAVSFFFLSPAQQLLVLSLALITLAYSFPILRVRNAGKRIREIFFAKVFSISLVWSLVTVLLPAVNETFSSTSFWFLFAERVLFIFAITIPFEIRDMQQEKKWGNKTLPIVFGIQKSKRLACLLLILFCLLLLVQVAFSNAIESSIVVALILCAAIAGILVYFTNEHRNNFYFKLYVDGTMMLQYILVILFS